MPNPPSYSQDDIDFIGFNLGTLSYPEIAEERNLSLSCVKRIAIKIKKNELIPGIPNEPNQLNRPKNDLDQIDTKKQELDLISETNELNRTEPTEPNHYKEKVYSTEYVSQLIADFDKEREEIQEAIDTLNFKNKSLLQDISNYQTIIKKQKLEIENKDIQIFDYATTIENLSKETELMSFIEFSDYLLSKSKKSGSNSYSLGEIKFRRSDLKNIYLMILHFKKKVINK